jgi:hypothetical protein
MVDTITMLLPIALIGGTFALILGTLWFWTKVYRGKTQVEFFRDMDGRYYKVGSKRIDQKLDRVSLKDKEFHLDYGYAVMAQSLLRGNYAILRFDIEDAKPLGLGIAGAPVKFNPRLFHKVLTTQIYSNILSGITENAMFMLLIVMIAFSLLAGIGGAVLSYQNQQQIQQIATTLQKLIPVVPKAP